MADPIENSEELEKDIPTEVDELEQSFDADEIDEMLNLSDDVSEEEVTEETPADDETPTEKVVEDEKQPEEKSETPAEEVQDDLKPEETPTEEVPEQPTDEERRAKLDEARTKWQDELAGQYQLSEEEAEQFVTEPEKVVPKLAAIIHARVMEETLQTVAQNMQAYMQAAFQQAPDMVTGAVSIAQQRQDAETAFFTEFPDLKDHGGSVAQAIKMVKAAPENQGISSEDLIVKAGNMTRAMLGLLAPAKAPAAPAQKPFTPAKPGASSVNQPAAEKSEWDDIIDTELI